VIGIALALSDSGIDSREFFTEIVL
jgi:hypothetical protein